MTEAPLAEIERSLASAERALRRLRELVDRGRGNVCPPANAEPVAKRWRSRRGFALSDETEALIRRLLKDGRSVAEVCAAAGVSKSTVYQRRQAMIRAEEGGVRRERKRTRSAPRKRRSIAEPTDPPPRTQDAPHAASADAGGGDNGGGGAPAGPAVRDRWAEYLSAGEAQRKHAAAREHDPAAALLKTEGGWRLEWRGPVL